jgi:hypothetical protein
MQSSDVFKLPTVLLTVDDDGDVHHESQVDENTCQSILIDKLADRVRVALLSHRVSIVLITIQSPSGFHNNALICHGGVVERFEPHGTCHHDPILYNTRSMDKCMRKLVHTWSSELVYVTPMTTGICPNNQRFANASYSARLVLSYLEIRTQSYYLRYDSQQACEVWLTQERGRVTK